MKTDNDYIRDIADIRSMMEHSTKFLSLSGWAGVLAGIYALLGAWLAYSLFHFDPGEINSAIESGDQFPAFTSVVVLALIVLILAVSTAVYLSYHKAKKRGEKVWNATSRRLLVNMAVPLVTGGVLILVLISWGLAGFTAPLTLIFYGLALFNAGRDSYREVRMLGLMEISLGLVGACFIDYSLIIWAIGFGLLHIIYGIYIHYKYER